MAETSARRRRGRALRTTGRSAKARARPDMLRAARQYVCGLSPDTELLDQPFVAREIARAQVVKQAPAFADQPEQSATRMMVFLVRPEVTRQLLDPRRQNRHLNFRRATVIGGSSVGLNDFAFASERKRHQEFLLSLFPLS
jgi:hypothetical protein